MDRPLPEFDVIAALPDSMPILAGHLSLERWHASGRECAGPLRRSDGAGVENPALLKWGPCRRQSGMRVPQPAGPA